MLRKLGNYNLFLASNALLSFAMGMFAPFWIVFIQDFGGRSFEQFGFSIGLMVLAQSITSYFAGRYSDKLGRKTFLIAGGFMLAAVTFAYTIITSIPQLYILQVIDGAVGAIQLTTGTAFLGDITTRTSRGKDLGKYHALVGIMSAIAMMGSGFVVGQSGYKIIFYITAGLIFISTLFLFSIKER